MVGFGHLAFRVMLVNAFSCCADFRSTDRPGNGLVEYFQMLSVALPNQIADLLAVDGAAVRHSEQDALDFQLRVYLPPHFANCLQKLFQTLGREVLRLHRNQCRVCRRQCIDSEHPQRGSAVQQNIIVLAFGTVQHLFEHLFPVHAVDKGNFHSCQLNVGRDKVNTLIMVQDALTGLDGLVIHSFLHESG